MKILSLWLLLLSSFCSAEQLILSSKLSLDYDPPALISHTQSSLIVKYEDWYFAHEVVDPENFYQQINLTGIERDFIKSLFDKDLRKQFPKWLAALSEEQASELEISVNNTLRKKVGDAELLAAYSNNAQSAHIYIFDDHSIHHLTYYGSKDNYRHLISRIKER